MRLQAPSCGQRGLTILELTLIIVMISVLMVFTLERMVSLRVDIERAAVKRTLAAMRGALALEFARLRVAGKTDEIRKLAGANPLELVETQPTIPGTQGQRIGPGRWHYDGAQGHVVYRPAYPEALTGDPQAVGRWRVTVTGQNGPTGIQLEAVEPLQLGADKARPE